MLAYSAPIGVAIMNLGGLLRLLLWSCSMPFSRVIEPQAGYTDFIRIGLIVAGLWHHDPSAEMLLADYVRRGLIPQTAPLRNATLPLLGMRGESIILLKLFTNPNYCPDLRAIIGGRNGVVVDLTHSQS